MEKQPTSDNYNNHVVPSDTRFSSFIFIFDHEHRSRGPRNYFDDSELFLKKALELTKMLKELL